MVYQIQLPTFTYNFFIIPIIYVIGMELLVCENLVMN